MSGTGMGPPGPSSIGGSVWEDEDLDGEPDPGEQPVAGAVVSLIADQDGDGQCGPDDPVHAMTVTALDGTYLFSSLPDGEYCVDVTAPDGLLLADGLLGVVSIDSASQEGAQFDVSLIPESASQGES
jgi:hypothetical protein